MKIFQILGGFCHWDASSVISSLDEAVTRFAPDLEFVEAPDYVHEGWGYDASLDGDERFIRPSAPDGWIYDETTGTFSDGNTTDSSEERDIWDELATAYSEGVELA